MRLLVIVPTYNEAENISLLLPQIFDNLSKCTEGTPRAASAGGVSRGGVLVVDDGSPDGTASIVRRIIQERGKDDLSILERQTKSGLADAYLTGFKWGKERGYDVFLEMDADFSHKPEYIPQLYEAIQTHDAAIGSRNVTGGRVEGWSALRNFISKGGSLYSRAVLGCPIKDLTGGFNMWRLSALEKIGLSNIISRGYSFQIEMKYRAYKAGCKIKEVPITFPDRTRGVSKMSRKIFIEALLNIWRIRNV